MVFDNDKAQKKLDDLDKKIAGIERELYELKTIRMSLFKIMDKESFERDQDDHYVLENGRPKKIKVKPTDEMTGSEITDARREEIYNIVDQKATNKLNS